MATRTVGPLGPGQSFTETFTVTLPAFNIATGTPGLPFFGPPVSQPAFRTGPAFLGVRVDAGGDVDESDEANNAGFRAGTDLAAVTVVQPQTEPARNDTVTEALLNSSSVSENGRLTGTAGPGDVDIFRLRPSTSGRLTGSRAGRTVTRASGSPTTVNPAHSLAGAPRRSAASFASRSASTTGSPRASAE